MSPAMVDFRSPASSKLRSNQHRSKSSVADRIPSFPSYPILRSGGIPDPSPPLDRRNVGHGGSVSSPAPFHLPPSNHSTASERLSAPRFRKQRKYSGISRARPAVVPSDSGGDQGFTPFGPQMSRDASHDRVVDSAPESVREQLFGWKPFGPDSSSHSRSGTGFTFGAGSSASISSSRNIVSESVEGISFALGNSSKGNTGSGTFVFGSGIEKGSNLSRSSSQSSSAQSFESANSANSEGTKSFLGTGTSTHSNVESVRTGMPLGSSGFSFGADNVDFGKGGFVCGSGAMKDSSSHHSFSFGADNNSFYKLNTKKSINEENGMEPGFCVHNSGEKKTIHSSKSSSFTSGHDLLREQTERISKIDLKNSSDAGCEKEDKDVFSSRSCTETKANLDLCSSMEELRKLKIEASSNGENVGKGSVFFAFGSGANNSTCANKSSSSGAFEFSFSKLPEKMEKLNLHGTSHAVHVDTTPIVSVTESISKNAQFSQNSLDHDEGRSSKLHGGLKNQKLQSSCNEEHDVFIFGSSVPEKANSNKSSSLSFDEVKDKGVFIFERDVNKNTDASKSSSSGAFECSFSKLPEKMEKLNLHSFPYAGHEDTASTVSVTESSSKNDQFSQVSLGLDEGVFSKIPVELKNQNLQSSGNGEHENDNGVFVFGSKAREKTNSGKVSSLSFDECSTFKLPDEIRKMNLGSSDNEVNSLESKLESTCNPHNNKSAFVSSRFTSQFGKDNYCSRVTPLQSLNSYGLSVETTSSSSPVLGFQFSGSHTETPMEFRSQKQDISMLTKENLFTESHKNMNFGMKKEDPKGSKLKKKRGKSRLSTQMNLGTTKQLVHEDNVLEENQEQGSIGGYSPMDYSPYQETLVSDDYSRKASVASDETIRFDSPCIPNEAHRPGSVDGKEGEICTGSADGQKRELFSAAELFSANEGLLENEASECGLSLHVTSERSRVNETITGPIKENLASKDETFKSGILKKSSTIESQPFSIGSSIKQTENVGSSGFTFTSNFDGEAQSGFMSVSSYAQDRPSASRRILQRRSRVKSGQDQHPNTTVQWGFHSSNKFLFPSAHDSAGPKQERKVNDDAERVENVNGAKDIQESAALAAACIKAEEACENWRLRGNQAYADGDLSKAEGFYSRGVDSFPLKDVSKICSKALMLCYSNRAATRMSLGRLREALGDCKVAIAIDPSFLRARVRAGNILLSLGEPEDALQHFEKVLQLDKETKSDQKILLEAVDGLEKAQKLNDLMDQSSISLTKRTPDDAAKSLELISEALLLGPYSESLLEMKAEAFVKLRNFEEAIQICEQTLELAEKNAVVTYSDCGLKDDDVRSYPRLWRWRIISKSYFYLGKLEEANELLKKHEEVKPVIDKYWSKYPESSASFPVIVCELLRLKTAGNEAFQAGKHLEAVELYTAALALNTESRPFTAICFCNRAAAYQALGQIADAIADCSLAIALDSSYRKAISRRATLHEIIRDYEQAAADLRKLTSLLETSSEDKYSASGILGRSCSNASDLNQVRIRLCTVEEDARKGGTLDLYMILGIERSCSAADVRKAYRKAALRHHPDKAGQFLARSENGDDRVWREVAEEFHTNADRLFKMIGEAYTILVDPSKRSQYDAELDSRNAKKSGGACARSSSPRTPATSATTHSSQFENRSTDPRQWRCYGSSHRRWSENSWSNR